MRNEQPVMYKPIGKPIPKAFFLKQFKPGKESTM